MAPESASRSELRIVVADDHPVVLAGVKTLIDAAGDMVVVGEAVEGRSALKLATQLQPDVMVLDISMPGLGGPKVAELLRQASPRTRILMHTVHEDKGYLRQALELGRAAIFSSAHRATSWSGRFARSPREASTSTRWSPGGWSADRRRSMKSKSARAPT